MKIYVVQRIDYDYNDEYYETSGASPVKAFKDKEKAKKFMDQKNIEYASKHGWYSFTNYNTGEKQPPVYVFIDSNNEEIHNFYELKELEIDE